MEEEAMSKFRIGSLPTLYYIPDFVTADEQTLLLNNINQAPLAKWKTLKNRRLQNWGGVVHEKGLLFQNLPPWLSNLTRRISERTGLFPSAINHVLINEYLPDQGIMPWRRKLGGQVWRWRVEMGGTWFAIKGGDGRRKGGAHGTLVMRRGVVRACMD
ncbi:unnamed protein product [Rhodiola kirilowii]